MKRFLAVFAALALSLCLLSVVDAQSRQTGSKPSTSTPTRTYGSGSKPSTTPKTTPTVPSTTPGKSYGSGAPPKVETPKTTVPSTTPGKSYGSGAPTKTTDPPKGANVGEKPKTVPGGYDAKAGKAQAKEESKKIFQKGTAPASTYTDAKGRVQFHQNLGKSRQTSR